MPKYIVVQHTQGTVTYILEAESEDEALSQVILKQVEPNERWEDESIPYVVE